MTVTVKNLLEAGVHFGHQTKRWNPQMQPYLFGARGGVHIIDLEQTVGYLHQAAEAAEGIAAKGGTILFVGTKRQGKEAIKAAAERAHMPYVTERWLGGLLTNWETISTRLEHFKRLVQEQEAGDWERLPKKEVARKTEELEKLQTVLRGVKDLTEVPQALFVSDVVREDLAVAEGKKLKLPIIGVVDSNADPKAADYLIPGNDDAIKAIKIIADTIADACLKGRETYEKQAAAQAAQAAKDAEKAAAEKAKADAKAKAEAEEAAAEAREKESA